VCASFEIVPNNKRNPKSKNPDLRVASGLGHLCAAPRTELKFQIEAWTAGNISAFYEFPEVLSQASRRQSLLDRNQCREISITLYVSANSASSLQKVERSHLIVETGAVQTEVKVSSWMFQMEDCGGAQTPLTRPILPVLDR
jgi:hypothetical protein